MKYSDYKKKEVQDEAVYTAVRILVLVIGVVLGNMLIQDMIVNKTKERTSKEIMTRAFKYGYAVKTMDGDIIFKAEVDD